MGGCEKVVNNFRSVFLLSLFTLIFSTHLIFADDNFVLVEGGSFVMGSPVYERGRNNGERQHRVRIKSFYISEHPVTQEEYEEIMETNPSIFEGENLPVESVSWFDAIEYCNRRSEKEGLNPVYTIDILRIDLGNLNSTARWLVTWDRKANGYRLPTEAEWEYAAKGGNEAPGGFIFAGSNEQTEVAWYSATSGGKTHPVGEKTANKLGLYDMSGNVWEWCWDWYGDYKTNAQTDPIGASLGSKRVIRGGSWYDSAAYVRSAYRNSFIPSNMNFSVGFRIVRTALPENWTEYLLQP
jgi:formylglycine-generating enzyme required for sulfatase activity